MFQDMRSYLPDDILCKVDRAAMGISLETRIPFLDPDVIALSARMPLNMKIRDGQSKWPLRQILYRYVPRDLIERPKRGFSIPIATWLRGPLRPWAERSVVHSRAYSTRTSGRRADLQSLGRAPFVSARLVNPSVDYPDVPSLDGSARMTPPALPRAVLR